MGWHKFQGIERRERKGKKEKKDNLKANQSSNYDITRTIRKILIR
jgi:hypothetical protein